MAGNGCGGNQLLLALIAALGALAAAMGGMFGKVTYFDLAPEKSIAVLP